jgi:hypothetical protein
VLLLDEPLRESDRLPDADEPASAADEAKELALAAVAAASAREAMRTRRIGGFAEWWEGQR